MPDPADAVGAILAEVIRFASAGEKINAAARACELPLSTLAEIQERDPELQPEVVAAITQLGEVIQTLRRAYTFVDARLDARLATIADSLGFPPTEGGTPE